MFEVSEEGGLHGTPTEAFLSELAGGRAVDRDEGLEKAEMIGWLADDRHIQSAVDDFSNISKRYAFFGNPVVPGSRNALLVPPSTSIWIGHVFVLVVIML